MLRLTTFAISHFSEKVRWALDFEGALYDERRLLPGPHLFVTKRLASASSVPILEHGRRVVQGSSAILDYMSAELGFSTLSPPDATAAARCAELEALADVGLGQVIQRVAYDALLPDRNTVIALWTQGGPVWGRAFYALAYRRVAAAVKRMYDINPDSVARAKDRFRKTMEVLDGALGNQPYFMGDRPGRLDIAVAALLAPLSRPAEHLVRWPELPETVATFTKEFAASRTWRHALAMYRLHRRGAAARA
jgi:glutathione S-transferase